MTMVSVFKPPAQDAAYFLNWLSQIIDFYSITYEKQFIIGDFNLTPDNKSIREFVNLYNLINLIKTTTCFKGTWSCIDLLLTNQKFSFKVYLRCKTLTSQNLSSEAQIKNIFIL